MGVLMIPTYVVYVVKKYVSWIFLAFHINFIIYHIQLLDRNFVIRNILNEIEYKYSLLTLGYTSIMEGI